MRGVTENRRTGAIENYDDVIWYKLWCDDVKTRVSIDKDAVWKTSDCSSELQDIRFSALPSDAQYLRALVRHGPLWRTVWKLQ